MPGKKVCRMHGGAKGSGAPVGSHNSLSHGLYSNALPESERPMYEGLRVNPANLDDEIALMRVKIFRWLKNNPEEAGEFNLESFENEVVQEKTNIDENGSATRITKRRKNPFGPDVLIKSLDLLRKLLLTKHQISPDAGEEEDPSQSASKIRIAMGEMDGVLTEEVK